MYLNVHLTPTAIQIIALFVLVGLAIVGEVAWHRHKIRKRQQELTATIAAEQAEADKVWTRMGRDLRERMEAAVAKEDDRYTTANPQHYRDRLAQAQMRHPSWPWSDRSKRTLVGAAQRAQALADPSLAEALLEFPSEVDIHGSAQPAAIMYQRFWESQPAMMGVYAAPEAPSVQAEAPCADYSSSAGDFSAAPACEAFNGGGDQ